MKKKVWVITLSIAAMLLLLGGAGAYFAYNQVGDYFITQTMTSELTKELVEQTGIDLSETGRVLTEEEIERFQSVLNTKEDIAQTETTQVDTTQQIRPAEDKPVEVKPAETKSDKPSRVTEPSKTSQKVTTDDLRAAVKKQAEQITSVVPHKDKSAMLNLVVSNLTSSDINYLVGLVLDGVSSSDLAEAKRIAKERFSSHELEQVRGYYDTYKHLLP